jgi:hypothetical protein
MDAMFVHAVALSRDFSQSFARRRQLPSPLRQAQDEGECALDDPSARQDDKALGGVGTLDDFDLPSAKPGERAHQFGTGIAAVSEDVAQPGKAETKGLDHEGSAVSVLNIGGMDQREERETERIGDDVTLAAFDLLSRVIA